MKVESDIWKEGEDDEMEVEDLDEVGERFSVVKFVYNIISDTASDVERIRTPITYWIHVLE